MKIRIIYSVHQIKIIRYSECKQKVAITLKKYHLKLYKQWLGPEKPPSV